jgi:RhtB (resistance to homoserine/threonine) family protein
MDTTFWTVAVIGSLAVISPGPDFLIVTRNSLLYSKRVGLATALGIAAGNVWWIAASILGISYIISQTVFLFHAIKWLGALYLIYLGMCSLTIRRQGNESRTEGGERSRSSMAVGEAFRIGLLTNLLNPKCALFFVSLFSVVIHPETPIIFQCVYGAEIMIIAVCWFSLLATVLSVERVKAVFGRCSTWLERVTGALLIALGVKVALSSQK